MVGHVGAALDRRVVRTRTEIEAALLSLLEEYEFSEITVQMILDRSSYSRGAFYTNYKNKDDCLKHILENEAHYFVREFLSAIETISDEVLERQTQEYVISLAYFERILAKAVLYRLVLIDSATSDWSRLFLRKAEAEFVAALKVSAGEGSSSSDLGLYHYTEFYRFIAAIRYWIQHDFDWSPQVFAQYYSNLRSFNFVWDRQAYQ